MNISMRRFVAADGERFAVLIDGSGMPLYYPTLYTTWHLRSRSLAANSIVNALGAIKALSAWEARVGINLVSLFSQGELLGEERVRDLSDFLQLAFTSAPRETRVVQIVRRPQAVDSSVHHFRITIVADYLEFLARRLCSHSRSEKEIKSMAALMKANRPSKPRKSVSERDDRHLDDVVIDVLERALKPGSDGNPVKDYSIQVRNALMFMILRLTGIRRGELLNLKVNDIDFGKNTLRVVRRPDSKSDARPHQPTAKTRQRTIPIAQELMANIHDYVLSHRNKLPEAKRHGYLFVSHKSGPAQGRPLSISAFQKWMSSVASIVPDAGIRAHALRHHWNFVFSRHCDSLEMSAEKEEKIRSYLMGWQETSGTARIYNRRHIKNKAAESVLAIQNNHLNRFDGEVVDD